MDTTNEKVVPTDIGAIDTVTASNRGAEIQLRHPVTNAPTGVFVTVIGKDSDTFREFQRVKFNEYLREEARQKSNRRNQSAHKSAEDLEDDMLTLLVSCTKGWRNMLYKGNILEFTPENVRMVYLTTPWVRDAVNDAVGDLGNFLKA